MSMGDDDVSHDAEDSDGSEDEASFWCVSGGSDGILGAYNHSDEWQLNAAALRRADQVMVSLHERLHHELQHTTPWGLIARFAKELAEQNIDPDRLRLLFRFCRKQSAQTHETYATTMSLIDAVPGAEFLSESPDYRAYFEQGRRLARAHDWSSGRFVADAILRSCMAPAMLGSAFRGDFVDLRLTDLETDAACPDRRLATALALELPEFSPADMGKNATPAQLAAFYDEVAHELTRQGLPTLDSGGISAFIEDLFTSIRAISPALADRTSLDETREPVSDDMEEHQRETLILQDSGPLPVEIIPPGAMVDRALDLVRHNELGPHVTLVWLPASQLAAKFARPNGLELRTGSVVVLQAVGRDNLGRRVVRVCPFDVDDPGPIVQAFQMPVVCITTASSLLAAPAVARAGDIGRIFAVVDAPVVASLLTEYASTAKMTWTSGRLDGGRHLKFFVFLLNIFPGVFWLQITGFAGQSYTWAWLESLDPDTATRSPDMFDRLKGEIDAAVHTVVDCWYDLRQTSTTV